MRQPVFPIFLVLSFSVLLTGCKKQKEECGCNSTTTDHQIIKGTGKLSYFAKKAKWAMILSPDPISNYYYFPCNPELESLQEILKGADHAQQINVEFSGDATDPCPYETFGYTNGITLFYYIKIESLKAI